MRTTANKLAAVSAFCFIALAQIDTAQGASFDCGKAQTKVEHIICDNPDISKLDEELAQSYKAALQDQTKAAQTKRKQKLWVKERNNCPDVDCVKQVYKARVQALYSSPGGATPTQKSKQRFKVTEGTGYSVCENYAKFLNALPESEPLPLCHLKRAPDFPDLKDPDWEEMDIPANLELVYTIEKIHAISYHSRPVDTFEHWKEAYEQQIRSGEITPRLRRTRLVLVDNANWKAVYEQQIRESPQLSRTRLALIDNAPLETILAYEQDRDECDKDMRRRGYADNGARTRLFIWNEQEQQIEEYTSWIAFSSDFELMLYQGKPLLFSPYWGDGIYPRLTGGISVYHLVATGGGNPYGHLRRCQISFELPSNIIERMTK